MCQQAVRNWTLALAVGFVGAGFLAAEEPSGNWFTRMFAWPTSTAKKESSAAKSVPKASVAPVIPLSKAAQTDYLRRMEACDRLREIALAKNDTELMRQADQLEQRSWDLFVQTTHRMTETPSVDEVVLEKNLKTEPAGSRRLLSIPTVFGGRAESKNGLASRKEE